MDELGKTENTERRAAVYIRARDNNPDAAALQLRICNEALDALDWKLEAVVLDGAMRDDALDGSSREALLRLARDGRVDVVVVARSERIARGPLEWSRLHDTLGSLGVDVYSCLDTMPTPTLHSAVLVNAGEAGHVAAIVSREI